MIAARQEENELGKTRVHEGLAAEKAPV